MPVTVIENLSRYAGVIRVVAASVKFTVKPCHQRAVFCDRSCPALDIYLGERVTCGA